MYSIVLYVHPAALCVAHGINVLELCDAHGLWKKNRRENREYVGKFPANVGTRHKFINREYVEPIVRQICETIVHFFIKA